MTIKARPSQAVTLRAVRCHPLATTGEKAMASKSNAEPAYSDSPEAKYKTTGFIAADPISRLGLTALGNLSRP
ncbi:MAG TPA: hypothetical protein VLL05_00405 [Terriglobales bacterium]|nr:hypothetical protein [Terriglobales bacterium]